MHSPDVLVIGAGHNGLICAAYLTRAGIRAQVLERRQIPGGCAATEEMAPGIRVNRCHCDHIFLYTTPIPADLELERHGLENLESDPCHWAPCLEHDGLVFWRDVERTADSIGRRKPRQPAFGRSRAILSCQGQRRSLRKQDRRPDRRVHLVTMRGLGSAPPRPKYL